MRLVNADNLIAFPYEPTSGTEEVIYNWINEIMPDEAIEEYEDKLVDLCWKVVDGFIGVIETEETAYDVDKVMEQLEEMAEHTLVETSDNHPFAAYEISTINKKKAIEIVKGGAE